MFDLFFKAQNKVNDAYNEGFTNGRLQGYGEGYTEGYRKKLLTQYDRVINLTQYGFYICNSEYADILEIALNLACQQIAYDHIGTAEYFQDYFLKRAKEVKHEKATSKEMEQT